MNRSALKIVANTLPSGLTLSQATQRARVPRRPKHSFVIKQRPYEITPFMIAPVLAGETMKNLLLQCRTVSTPLKNRLIGHHLEHYFFYVKLRDLADSEDLVEMLMDTGGNQVDVAAANAPLLYVRQGAIDYVKLALDSVTKHYFRDEGDDQPHVGAVTGLPLAQWSNYQGIYESLVDNADLPAGQITDDQPFGDHEKEYQTWEFMRQMQLTELSFEDYLGTFGVRTSNEALNRPELIRMVKNWTYPTNTVSGDGDINTQASWSVQERADKDRFFKEPGFIFGVSIARPKLYLSQQTQASVSLLNDALSWLPAMMKDNVMSTLKKVKGNAASNPLASAATPTDGQLKTTDDYWFDVRDLFVHGDQFLNSAPSEGVDNAVRAEDWTDFQGKKYPHSASLQALGVGDTLTYDSDGVVSLNILGTQVDVT